MHLATCVYISSFVTVLSHMVSKAQTTSAKFKRFTSFCKLRCGLWCWL